MRPRVAQAGFRKYPLPKGKKWIVSTIRQKGRKEADRLDDPPDICTILVVNEIAGITYENTILESLGVRVIEMTTDRVVMELDIGPKVHQPMGILHGGASAVLAESAASMGTFMNLDPETQYAVGIELNVSHLKSKTTGLLRAIATPIRKGRGVHVWNIDLKDEDEKPVAVSRCTVLIRSWDAESNPEPDPSGSPRRSAEQKAE